MNLGNSDYLLTLLDEYCYGLYVCLFACSFVGAFAVVSPGIVLASHKAKQECLALRLAADKVLIVIRTLPRKKEHRTCESSRYNELSGQPTERSLI